MQSIFGIGTIKLKDNSGTLQVRNAADDAFLKIQALAPAANDDVATKGSSDTAIAAAVNSILNKMEARVTLTTATPITTSDVTAAETIYYTPMEKGIITLYDGSALWEAHTLTEISIAVPDTTDTGYDIFVYNSSGTLTLELVAWTSLAARATELALQNGIKVKSGSPEKRYVGSFQTGSVSGQTLDAVTARYLWNEYNKVLRDMIKSPGANWTYATASLQLLNADATGKIACFVGDTLSTIQLQLQLSIASDTGVAYFAYIGFNAETASAASPKIHWEQSTGGVFYANPVCSAVVKSVLGHNYACGLELAQTGTTYLFSSGNIDCVIRGSLWM